MSSPDSAQGRHCAVEFQALPSRIGQVRRIVSAQLRYWRLDPLVDRVGLGLTELLANVHRHAGPDKRCAVELTLAHRRLTVSVRDHGRDLPRLRPSGALATDGRGLALVAALSEDWGIRPQQDGSGKVVWFTLPVPAPDAAASRPAAATVPARPDLTATGGAPAPPVAAAVAATASPVSPALVRAASAAPGAACGAATGGTSPGGTARPAP